MQKRTAEGMPDSRRAPDAGHIHVIAVPPKHPVASVIGYFWARRYAVSTIGFELELVRQDIREQETLTAPIEEQLEALKNPDRRSDARVELDRAFTRVNENARSKDPHRQAVAMRARQQAFIEMFETASDQIADKHYAEALILMDVVVQAAAHAPGAHIQKSRIYMLMDKESKALAEARLAVKDGVADPEAFSDPEFAPLRSDPAFKALFP